MKKFISKARLLVVLWTIRQKIHLTEKILEQVGRDITGAREVLNLVEDYIPDSGIARKLAKLEADRQAKQNELEQLRQEENMLREKLAA